MKIRRKMINIDEEKCDGCGLCMPACPEGALQIVETPNGPKARVVKESFCDGLGACLGDCPQEALSVEEREVEEYDEEGVIAHVKEKSPELLEKHLAHLKAHADELPQHHHGHSGTGSCPGAQMLDWKEDKKPVGGKVKIPSELRQWPIQLHLVPPSAPYFKDADLAIVADCVPFAYANFHQEFLKEKAIAVGCPKLDEVDAYIEKITQIIKTGKPKSIKVLHMEVPCCFGLVHIVQQAIERSGENVAFEAVKISISGERLT
ncbi:MAG: 4Fe-4S binding protein [Candidatus Zixiibacteriota bacterium]|nr:MAG: 4Fe-4S binding protein [candidate division Zixibacteria bacterium]